MGKCKYDYSWSCKNMHASSQRPKMHKSARSRLWHAGRYGYMRTGTQQDLADTVCAPSQAALVYRTVTRKFPVNSNGRMERLLCNFHYLGYYCSPNLSIHQNSTQEPTWNFLVTLVYRSRILSFKRVYCNSSLFAA